jgi:hypothetical protein
MKLTFKKNTMKTELNEVPAKTEPSYPYLKINRNTGCVVLFTEKDKGTCVYQSPTSTGELGDHLSCWEERNFELFNGTITLSND